MTKRIYLAGPEVFCPNPRAIGQAKKDRCKHYGLEGVFPMDADVDLEELPLKDAGRLISRANEDLMRSCDLLIANMTPFRGPSMDVGTAFEMGFMRGLGRPVLGYTNVSGTFLERTTAQVGNTRRREETGEVEDGDGMLVKDFDMVDNPMVHGAVLSSDADVVVVTTTREQLFTDLSGFEACVRTARNLTPADPLR